MNYELDDKLLKEFSFYKGYFGKGLSFSCGDGWFDLLYDFSKKIQKALDEGVIHESFSVHDIKEKYGTLRIYTNFISDEIDDLIEEAEKKSEITCEVCGEPAILRNNGGWLTTLCETCHQTNLIRLEEQYNSLKRHIEPNEDKNAKTA